VGRQSQSTGPPLAPPASGRGIERPDWPR
jgi:hypothetical protein